MLNLEMIVNVVKLFLKLPRRKEYPDYYIIIQNLYHMQQLKLKLKNGHIHNR